MPADSRQVGQQLLYRAGYLRQAGGQIVYLPLGQRSIAKIVASIREKLFAAGAEEVLLPAAPSLQKTLLSHLDLIKNEIHSYRQLPLAYYHFGSSSSKAANTAEETSSRGNLLIDGIIASTSHEEALERAHGIGRAFGELFSECQITTAFYHPSTVTASGTILEYLTAVPFGPDTLVHCPACGYSANLTCATIHKQVESTSIPLPIERVATPGIKTIDNLAQFLSITPSQTAKAVFLVAEYDSPAGAGLRSPELVFAIIRGDMDVSDAKLCYALGASRLRPATEPEIRASGAVPGYASPVGLSSIKVVVDDLIPDCVNLAAGANEEGYHLLNVNFLRDYKADIIADIATVRAGDPCPVCRSALQLKPAYSLASVTLVNEAIASAAGCSCLDADGKSQPVHLAAFRLELSAVLSVIAEQHHDEHGLCLPRPVAPADIYLMTIPAKELNLDETLQQVLARLVDCGYTVLVDDRPERAGVKFNDADLIGIPLRLTLSERSLKSNALEAKMRTGIEPMLVTLDNLETTIKSLLNP